MMFMVSPVQTATGAGAWDWIGCAQPTVAARVQHRLPLARSGEGAESCNACQESNAVIIVGDERLAEAACAAHRLVCPDCGGRLRKHGFSRPRSVRTRGGGRRALRPARARCTGPACRRTHVLLPAWCVPGRADDADTIGSALLAAASGEGHRPIAERLKVPEGTVRGWLRAARAHTGWLYQVPRPCCTPSTMTTQLSHPAAGHRCGTPSKRSVPPRQRSDASSEPRYTPRPGR